MTNIEWPSDVKIPKLSGLNSEYENAVVRTQMDAGPAKQRQRFTAVPKKYSGSLSLKEDERQVLENFWKESLAHGTLRFKMKNPQTGVKEEFRFTSPYSEECNDNGVWEIKLPLERLP